MTVSSMANRRPPFAPRVERDVHPAPGSHGPHGPSMVDDRCHGVRWLPFAWSFPNHCHTATSSCRALLPGCRRWMMALMGGGIANDKVGLLIRKVPPGLPEARTRGLALVEQIRQLACEMPLAKLVIGGFSQGAMTAGQAHGPVVNPVLCNPALCSPIRVCAKQRRRGSRLGASAAGRHTSRGDHGTEWCPDRGGRVGAEAFGHAHQAASAGDARD